MFEWRDLAFADTDAEHAIGSLSFDALHESGGAVVVESGAIDQRLIRGNRSMGRCKTAAAGQRIDKKTDQAL